MCVWGGWGGGWGVGGNRKFDLDHSEMYGNSEEKRELMRLDDE